MPSNWLDLALLLLRLGAGLPMALAHGLPKLQKLLAGDLSFADPIGLGPGVSLVLAVLTEFVGALLVAAGFFTRWAAALLAFTMLVAFAIVHGDDGWGKMELAYLYFIAFSTLALIGAGRYALDYWWAQRRMV